MNREPRSVTKARDFQEGTLEILSELFFNRLIPISAKGFLGEYIEAKELSGRLLAEKESPREIERHIRENRRTDTDPQVVLKAVELYHGFIDQTIEVLKELPSSAGSKPPMLKVEAFLETRFRGYLDEVVGKYHEYLMTLTPTRDPKSDSIQVTPPRLPSSIKDDYRLVRGEGGEHEWRPRF